MLPPCFCALAGVAKVPNTNAVTRKIGASLRARVGAFIEMFLQIGASVLLDRYQLLRR
jgi:hypothetical protein